MAAVFVSLVQYRTTYTICCSDERTFELIMADRSNVAKNCRIVKPRPDSTYNSTQTKPFFLFVLMPKNNLRRGSLYGTAIRCDGIHSTLYGYIRDNRIRRVQSWKRAKNINLHLKLTISCCRFVRWIFVANHTVGRRSANINFGSHIRGCPKRWTRMNISRTYNKQSSLLNRRWH